MKKILFLIFIIPAILSGQTTKKDSIWMSLKPFIGNWKGEGGGDPGKGKYERSYEFILNKNFIEIKNKSTYEPNSKYPNGEVHEDIGYFSYDKSAKKFKLRQFHVEGFVNEFTLDSISPDKKLFVFITYAIENIPRGWRGKETFRFIGENEVEEIFELSEPDKDFKVYSSVKLFKQK